MILGDEASEANGERETADLSAEITRRGLLRGLAAAGAALAAGAASGQGSGKSSAPKPETVPSADFAIADRLTGHAYGEPERALMAQAWPDTRAMLLAVRRADIPGETAPAFDFEPRLPGMATPKTKSGCRPVGGHAVPYNGDAESLAFLTVAELAKLVQSRKITATALTQMYLARLKTLGPRLNCVVTLTEELALRQAAQADRDIARGHYRGPLHGIPWGAKDLLATKDIPTTWGAKPFEKQIFGYDATVVQRLEAAGAVLVAKLSMGELAQGDVWFGGLTRNPWNPKRGASGSSAGPGSATAAGLVGFSIGTETLGSIVSPSVVNGVTGLRPTFGRVPRTGAMALSWTMDKIGPMCRGVEDCALVLNAIHGPNAQDGTMTDIPFGWQPKSDLRRLRVGINQEAFDAISKADGVRGKIYRDALDALQKLGVTFRPIALPKDNPAYGALAELIIGVESAAAFQRITDNGQVAQLARQTASSWPTTFRVGALIPAADYVQAMRVRRRLQEEMAEVFRDVDGYVSVPFLSSSLVYTNLTGHPALITRCGMVGASPNGAGSNGGLLPTAPNGLPVSIEFVGNLFREDVILRLGYALEQATNWHTQWPDTSKIPPLS